MKAKTKTRLIMVLNALLGVVFAFMIGFTYSSSTATKVARTNRYSTASYLANNNWELVNSTLENPIPFGAGAKPAEVAISYTLFYDAFDFMLSYSLTWSDGTSASDDVILLFSDRDNFIVDENYIYYNKSITKGEGKFNIITGVEFLNPEDETLEGKSLTINVTATIAEKSTSYEAEGDNQHPLYKDSIAGNAWIKIKNGTMKTATNADIIVYNYRYTQANGIVHPDAVTAYKSDGKTVTGTDGKDKTVYYDTTKLYGNTYNAGAGLYVMTGKNSVTITVQSIGYWEKTQETTDVAFTNNIHYNFTSTWGTVTYFNENHTQASITIGANQTVYLNIYDNIEITSIMETSSQNISYEFYKLLSSFNVNGKLIQGNKITTLSSVSSASETASTYTTKDYDITNTSVYASGLYDASSSSGAKEYPTNLAITNKTAKTVTYSISYQPQYTTSNGAQTLQTAGGSATDFTGSYWAKTSDTCGTKVTTTVVVAPYSTVTIASSISAPELSSTLFKNGSYYDAWISLEVSSISISSTSETELTTGNINSLSVEAKTTDSGTDFYLRNNSNVTATFSGNISILQISYTYPAVTSQPANWSVDFWKYFYISNGNYVRATATSVWGDTTYYSREEDTTTQTITVHSDNSITLVPGESKKVGSSTFTGLWSVQGSVQGTVATGSVGIVNNGTSSAFIKNDSANSYYVRFSGTASAQSDIKTVSSYNYYIGIVRPGQIVNIPMTASGTIQTIAVSGDYSSSVIKSWTTDTTVTSAFETYFS